MENYTLGLALFDYLPVIAAGFGLFLICRYSALLGGYAGPWVVLIPAIALIGGTLKATWKLIWALQAVDVRWMSDQLFLFLATAYVLMAAFVIGNLRAHRQGSSLAERWWLVPLVLIAGVIGAAAWLRWNVDGRAWSMVLLATLSLANLVFLISLITHSARLKNRVATTAFIVNLVLSYVLVGLARMEQTAQLQWIEEGLNLANNSMLALGAWALLKARRQRG